MEYKLYCPKGHEIIYNEDTAKGPFCLCYCTKCFDTNGQNGRPYVEMDCLTEEQLKDSKLSRVGMLIAEMIKDNPYVPYVYDLKNQESETQSDLSVTDESQNSEGIKTADQSDGNTINSGENGDRFGLEGEAHPWINFSDRKPEVGQEIEVIQLITDEEFEGVYDSPFSSDPTFAGFIQTINGCMRAFKTWRPAQPEMQERSDVNVKELGSNTQEFEKKDCVFDSIIGKHITNIDGHEYCIEHKQYHSCTVRENRTDDIHTKPQDPIHIENDMHREEQECDHDLYGVVTRPDIKFCMRCEEFLDSKGNKIDLLKSQSQIPIEKVIEAFYDQYLDYYSHVQVEPNKIHSEIANLLLRITQKLQELVK